MSMMTKYQKQVKARGGFVTGGFICWVALNISSYFLFFPSYVRVYVRSDSLSYYTLISNLTR